MDPLSKERRREVMQKIGRKNTPPEVAVRRCLHAMGCRFRLHAADLPGKPDIVMPRRNTVVLVHGCFWHGCPLCFRGHRVPKTNRDYWLGKIERNQARDARNVADLQKIGWRVLAVWECEVKDPQRLRERLAAELADEPAQADQTAAQAAPKRSRRQARPAAYRR